MKYSDEFKREALNLAAQWACEPDPLPDLAVAPGLRVAPCVGQVGGGSRFSCAERPIRPATSPGAGPPFLRAG